MLEGSQTVLGVAFESDEFDPSFHAHLEHFAALFLVQRRAVNYELLHLDRYWNGAIGLTPFPTHTKEKRKRKKELERSSNASIPKLESCQSDAKAAQK